MTDLSSPSCDPELHALLGAGLEREASDLHLAAGYPPTLRVHGRLQPAAGEPLTPEQARRMITSAMPAPVREKIGRQKDFDFSLTIDHAGRSARYRVNVFLNAGAMGACFRYVPARIPSFEWMGFPVELAQRIAQLPGGMVLITGVTGSGKTTTLAALVQLINQTGDRRIVTIEEPIEYVFQPASNSVITQREVGIDVDTFADGLKYSLRQDPDVILCGEIRDINTARMAISAAETGHLVMSTVHTQDARGAITRLVDIFPVDQQQDIRGQLSLSLRLVISQLLMPNVDPTRKRELATEVLVVHDAVRAAIRLNKVETIDSLIQTGKKQGMHTMDESLARLARAHRIRPEAARRFAKHPDHLGIVQVADTGMNEPHA
jgi:twitching motility protein PilT